MSDQRLIGPKGDRGERGPRGSQGPQGYTGDPGPQGYTGEQGPMGPQGIRGPQGPQGYTGESGERGDLGPKGERGDKGEVGEKGDKGDTGEPAHIELVIPMIDRAISSYDEKREKDDPFLLGTKRVNESGIGKDKYLMFNGSELVYVEPPKQKAMRTMGAGGGGRGVSERWRGKTITEAYTLDPHDQVIHVNASSSNIILTIYTAVGNDWRHHFIKRIDNPLSSFDVTFAMTASETLDFETLYMLINRGSGAEIYNDGSNWFFKSA